jgi:hypothetical protein
MKLNSKLTGGLAWAGLIVVLAVPSADMLMGRSGDASAEPKTSDAVRTVTPVAVKAPVTGTVAPVKVPTIETAAKGADPVDTFVQSGKKMPSYISDAPAATATVKPVQQVTQPAGPGVPSQTAATKPPITTGSVKPVEVANVREMHSDLVAPIPYPASKRPRVPLNSTTELTASTTPAKTVAPVKSTTPAVASTEQPLIVDETTVQRRDEAVARVLDEDVQVTRVQPRRVESDQLEQWDSGSLAEYLERKGLISGQAQASNSDFDEDGFFLDEGPNTDRSNARVVRRIRPANDFFF